jgi:type I restriction enzyme, S subunit
MSSGVTAQANRDAVGSSYPALNDSDVRRFEVFAPPIGEQVAIANVLDTIETTIRQTEAIIEKLKQVKLGLLHDLLTRGIDANGELRPPQSLAPHLYKDSPLGWIPMEWEAIHMFEAIRELGQGWSPDCPPEPAAADRWGVLKTTAVAWDGYADQENKTLPATLRPRPDLEVAPEDILITRAGPKERVAVVAYVAQTRPGLMISDKMYRLRLHEADVPAYFALALSSQYAQAAITRTISGMADSQTNISQPIIQMLQVMRPPTVEQRAISRRVAALADRLQAEQRQLTALGSLKAGLMDDLLTGRVRVTPLLQPEACA